MIPARSSLKRFRRTLTPCRRKVISFPLHNSYGGCMMIQTRPLAVLLALAAAPAHATTQDDVLFASLLSGWTTDGGNRMAGLDLTLAPGWKTYWRSPGDVGIPPVFDWSMSENVKSVRIHWPVPSVFEASGMLTIGYHDRVVLPLEVTPVDPSMPVTLKVAVDLGVCDEICLPAHVKLSTELAVDGAPEKHIKAALANRAASADEAGLSSLGCTVEPIADGLRLTARMRLRDPGAEEVVAFETADPAVWVAQAVTAREGGELVTMTELVPPDGAPFALDRSSVTLTILAAGEAVEVRGCPAP